uniref:Uncharacterized protein n=1 Tax=Acrobeloides nanus TaxID=290746 RepID=A0A914EMW2_9BILA
VPQLLLVLMMAKATDMKSMVLAIIR